MTGMPEGTPQEDLGVEPSSLTDEELLRELASLHGTRHDTLRHGSDDALVHHNRRMTELESEYLLRFPQREVDPRRTAPPRLSGGPHGGGDGAYG